MRASVLTSNRREFKRARRTRVLLNGEDVSMRCQAADSREGWAILFKMRDGKPYAERGELARERVHGAVRVERV